MKTITVHNKDALKMSGFINEAFNFSRTKSVNTLKGCRRRPRTLIGFQRAPEICNLEFEAEVSKLGHVSTVLAEYLTVLYALAYGVWRIDE